MQESVISNKKLKSLFLLETQQNLFSKLTGVSTW